MRKTKVKEKVIQAKSKLPAKKRPPLESGPIEIRMLSEEEARAEDSASEHELIDELNGAENTDSFKLEMNHHYFTVCVYALITISVAALIICLLVNFSSIWAWLGGFMKVLTSFVAAFFIAFILNPLVDWVEHEVFDKRLKLKKPKIRLGVSILVTYLLVLGLLVVGLVYVIPQITDSIVGIVDDVTTALNRLYENRDKYGAMIEEYFPEIDLVYFEKKLEEMWPTLLASLTNLTKNAVPMVVGVTVSLAKTAINALLAVAISIYMLADKRKLKRMGTQGVYAILPTAKAKVFCNTMKECSDIFSNFVSGKALDSLIIGIICFIALNILKLDYALLISVIVGITNMIPYFGPFIGAVPGVLLYLCISPVDAVVFTIMIFILQQFDGWILGPKILGDSTGLSPLWVIFGITVGGAYGGVIGMFIGVPLVAVAAHLLNKIVSGVLRKKRIEVS